MSNRDVGRELDAVIAEKVMGLELGERDWPCGCMPDDCGISAWEPWERWDGCSEAEAKYLRETSEAARESWYRERHPVYFRRHENGWAQRLVVPSYSTDIAAAWSVVEEMTRRMQAHSTAPGGSVKEPWLHANYLTLAQRGCFGVADRGGWAATFCCIIGSNDDGDEIDANEWYEQPEMHGGALADTAPHAICLAALAALTSEAPPP